MQARQTKDRHINLVGLNTWRKIHVFVLAFATLLMIVSTISFAIFAFTSEIGGLSVGMHSFVFGMGAGGLFVSLIGCEADEIFRKINRHAPLYATVLDLQRINKDAFQP